MISIFFAGLQRIFSRTCGSAPPYKKNKRGRNARHYDTPYRRCGTWVLQKKGNGIPDFCLMAKGMLLPIRTVPVRVALRV